jgi:hypothetical protein
MGREDKKGKMMGSTRGFGNEVRIYVMARMGV